LHPSFAARIIHNITIVVHFQCISSARSSPQLPEMVQHNGVTHHLLKATTTTAETASPIGALLFLGILFCLAAFGFRRLK
jgi:hypothetical protein